MLATNDSFVPLSFLALDRYDSAHKFVIYLLFCLSSFCSLLLLVSTLKLHTPAHFWLPSFPPSLVGCHKCAIRANNAFSTSLSQRNDASSSTLLSPLLATLLFLFLLHPHPPTILHTKENAILCISSASPSVHYLTSCICIFLSLCSRICIFTLCLSLYLYLCISDCAWASRTSSVSAHEVSIPS